MNTKFSSSLCDKQVPAVQIHNLKSRYKSTANTKKVIPINLEFLSKNEFT